MTTIKISKNPNEAPTASKAPLRRADPARRDRTQSPPKLVARVDEVQAVSKDKMDSRFRGNDEQGGARVNYLQLFTNPWNLNLNPNHRHRILRHHTICRH